MTTLTADAIRAMPAGAELDSLVREAACAAMREKLTEEQFRAITYGWDYHFRPSSEWRWAMEAAEWVGLFKDSPPFYVLKCSMGQWMVVPLAYFEEHGCALSVDNQGPACISRAIVMVASDSKPPEPTP